MQNENLGSHDQTEEPWSLLTSVNRYTDWLAELKARLKFALIRACMIPFIFYLTFRPA